MACFSSRGQGGLELEVAVQYHLRHKALATLDWTVMERPAASAAASPGQSRCRTGPALYCSIQKILIGVLHRYLVSCLVFLVLQSNEMDQGTMVIKWTWYLLS